MSNLFPIIGIPTWNRAGSAESKDLSACGVTNSYLKAITQSGGIPLLIPCFESIRIASALFPLIHGLLLAGGEDVNPRCYGQAPHEKLGKVSDVRDEVELYLIKQARQSKMPILGICRGAQILNVACGGTLIQDIPSEFPQAFEHQITPEEAEWHDLSNSCSLAPESRLAELFRASSILVNSLHHQAIARVGETLTVVATSKDGVVEGIEGTEGFFCVGIQAHPEMLFETADPRWAELFQTFVKESAEWKKQLG